MSQCGFHPWKWKKNPAYSSLLTPQFSNKAPLAYASGVVAVIKHNEKFIWFAFSIFSLCLIRYSTTAGKGVDIVFKLVFLKINYYLPGYGSKLLSQTYALCFSLLRMCLVYFSRNEEFDFIKTYALFLIFHIILLTLLNFKLLFCVRYNSLSKQYLSPH